MMIQALLAVALLNVAQTSGESCTTQIEDCYNAQGLLNTKKSIEATGNWDFLDNRPWRPDRSGLCSARSALNRCLNTQTPLCSSPSYDLNTRKYFVEINDQICSHSGRIVWNTWLNPPSRHNVWTNNFTKADEAYQGFQQCMEAAPAELLMNIRFRENPQTACRALVRWVRCDFRKSAKTADLQLYKNWAKTFVKMIWRATAKTYFKVYTEAPYACSVFMNRIGYQN